MAVQNVLRHCRRMTSTTIFGGFNADGRNSSKVLKPPGGGSSDIFGTDGGPSAEVATTPARRVKNHQQSNFFLSDEPAFQTPSRNQNGKDTHSRLFGAPPPSTPVSNNRMKSNILLNDDANDNVNEQKDDQKSEASDDYTDGTNGHENGHSEEPVNGGPMMNGNAAPIVNGNTQPAPAQRQRVPPGGFSSGLW